MILLLKHNWNLGIQNVFNDLWLLIRVNDYFRADSRLAPSQWEMSLQCNVVSHWLGARLESALLFHSQSLAVDDLMANFIAIDPSHKSHNASHKYPIMHHFVTEMCTHVHISVTKCCIVGYDTDAFWDLWNGSINRSAADVFFEHVSWQTYATNMFLQFVWFLNMG